MNDAKNLQTYIYIEQKSQKEDMEVYVLHGYCTDEFFLRVYMMLQCIYSERMIACKSLPQHLPNGRNYICFVTHAGFLPIAKRFAIKIPIEHRIE